MPSQPDRNIDQEDPVPREIGGDETAERRTDHRADQGRDSHPRHCVDQRAFVDRAQQDEPPDGVIIAPPIPCRMRANTKPVIELAKAQPIEPTMKTAMATLNTVRAPNRSGSPAACRDEDRQRQQIGRNREFQRQRAGADVRGDGGRDVAMTVESMFSMNRAQATIKGIRRSFCIGSALWKDLAKRGTARECRAGIGESEAV